MTTEQKKIWTNSATLRPKTGERRSEKAPTWGGDGEVDCPHCNRRVAFWLDAWEKAKEGVAFFSIALKRKDKQPATESQTEPQAASQHQTSLGFSGPGRAPEPSRKPQSGRGFDDDGEIPFVFAAACLASSLAFAALTAGAPLA